jgi:phosphoribosylformimino-5-aminoimidazole carboxamide ribotide isomerase
MAAANGADAVVVGLETASDPGLLAELIAELGQERVIFSLDLRGGKLLGTWDAWGAIHDADCEGVVRVVAARGVRRIIVLDLADVGEGNGTATEPICRWIRANYPRIELLAGGGVADIAAMRRLESWGVAGVLVASALHDGRITPDDWARYLTAGSTPQ